MRRRLNHIICCQRGLRIAKLIELCGPADLADAIQTLSGVCVGRRGIQAKDVDQPVEGEKGKSFEMTQTQDRAKTPYGTPLVEAVSEAKSLDTDIKTAQVAA